MNKALLLASLFTVLITSSFKCTKDQNSNEVSAIVGGSIWEANESLATKVPDGLTIQGTLHFSGDYSNIAIYLPRNYATGVYDIDTASTSVHASYMPHSYTNSMIFASHGKVYINEISTYISGSFNFTLSDSTIVESGTFKVKMP